MTEQRHDAILQTTETEARHNQAPPIEHAGTELPMFSHRFSAVVLRQEVLIEVKDVTI
ncbi:MAG: hypothetical protein ACR2N1_10265 [Rubripirellula sp.]